VAAVLWVENRPSKRVVAALAGELALGIAVAVALVTALLLARTGSPPDPGLALSYARIFAAGFALLPMEPLLGLSTIVYLTYVGALGTATVRAIRRDGGRALTGMLAWSGVFGLCAGTYYIGRSSADVLVNMFPAWAFALSLLALVTVRELAGDGRLTLPRVACLIGIGVLACSLAQTPAPWAQASRLSRDGGAPLFKRPEIQPFVARLTRPGEAVAILMPLGHRIAYNLDIDDVDPYTGGYSMKTREQLADVIASLREEGGRKLFVLAEATPAELVASLPEHGLRLRAREGGLQLWLLSPRRP
jgi:hypothetical protein